MTPAAFRAITAPGKRLRPALTVVFADLGGVFDAGVVKAAAAVELVQIGSLIHDDIIDGGSIRRGRPTINAVDGDPTAMVTGDLVLALAGQLAAELAREAPSFLAEGMSSMARGQLLEMKGAFDLNVTSDRHIAAARDKTGALFACACRLGAWCAELPAPLQNAASEYGFAFGITYQLVDDLLDMIGDPEQLGKKTGMDSAAGIYTLPVLLALEMQGGRRIARRLRRNRNEDVARAMALVRESPAMEAAVEAIARWTRRAEAAAAKLGTSQTALGLRRFPQSYMTAALSGTAGHHGVAVRPAGGSEPTTEPRSSAKPDRAEV